VVPTTNEQPEAVQPQAVQPQAPQRRKPPKVQAGKPSRTPQKGDLICGECGEANPPGRKFCSRCGASLAAAVVVKIPWYKRIFRRKPKQAMAGERPWTAKDGAKKKPKRSGLGKIVAPLRKYLSILLVALGLLYGIYAPFRHWVNDKYNTAKDKVVAFIHPQYDLVTVGPGTTSNEPTPLDPNHTPSMATDGLTNTYWLSPPPSTDFTPELDVVLTEQTNLAKIIVRTGASDDFQAHDRPKTLKFTFEPSGNEDEVELKNTPGEQKLTVHNGGGVESFTIQITDTYKSPNGTDMALTEIEFFEKK
jgi:hypothetical protein